MSVQTIMPSPVSTAWTWATELRETVRAELTPALFASLARADQRRVADQYLRGLLSGKGRKSVRNLAHLLGESASEQRLHHFVNDSTWEWPMVRNALGCFVERAAPPEAWVVHRMLIPKAGQHSVGVDRRFVPALGQMVNAQQAVGIWAASPSVSVPVGWRLNLSRAWLDDPPRRSRAAIPDDLTPEVPGDFIAGAAVEPSGLLGLPRHPVIVDARDIDITRMLPRLRAAGLSMLMRISPNVALCPVMPPLPGRTPRTQPAHLIPCTSREQQLPVLWTTGSATGPICTSQATAVRVSLATASGLERNLLLIGLGVPGRPTPNELWLTDMVDASPLTLLRLSKLLDRVDVDLAEVGEEVGMRDFTGRSFRGWHRHMTMASAALGIVTIARARAASLVAQAPDLTNPDSDL